MGEEEFENTRKNHGRAMDSLNASLESEQRAKGEALRIKKKLEGTINELEIALDHANKANAEGMQSINSKEMAAKRALEGALHTCQAELDSLLQAAKNSKEKAKHAMVDAARLADELRAEQDHTNSESRAKRSLETQLSEMETRLADAEEAAIRSGKATMTKLENRIRELEAELGTTQAHTSESMKAYQRTERKVKELLFSQDEDRKNQERMSELANKLQQKIKTYKQQIEEAEEIAALNLAKFRKAQQELEETEDRAKLADNSMYDIRMTRAGSIL